LLSGLSLFSLGRKCENYAKLFPREAHKSINYRSELYNSDALRRIPGFSFRAQEHFHNALSPLKFAHFRDATKPFSSCKLNAINYFTFISALDTMEFNSLAAN